MAWEGVANFLSDYLISVVTNVTIQRVFKIVGKYQRCRFFKVHPNRRKKLKLRGHLRQPKSDLTNCTDVRQQRKRVKNI